MRAETKPKRPFPKFASRLSNTFLRTSESQGHLQINRFGIAYRSEVPGKNSPLAPQGLQIGDTNLD